MSNEPIILEQIKLPEDSEKLPIIDSNTVESAKDKENKKTKTKKSKSKKTSNCDRKSGLKYNADMNASANHIVVKYPEVRFNYGKIIKRKLTSPLKIKRKFDLQCLLKRYH